MSQTKRIIFIRHAHRDTDQPSADNGLSEKGKTQAKKLARYFGEFLGDEKCRLFSSPKKRCQETLAPLAKELKFDFEVDARLQETGPYESDAELRERIRSFMSDWQGKRSGSSRPITETWIACSHGDWIPKMIFDLYGHWIPLKKAGFVVLEANGGDPVLTWVCQKVF